MKRVAIAGAPMKREDAWPIFDKALEQLGDFEVVTRGDPKGLDLITLAWAKERGLPIEVCSVPHWRHRWMNNVLVARAHLDHALILPHKDKSTQHFVRALKKEGVQVLTVGQEF